MTFATKNGKIAGTTRWSRRSHVYLYGGLYTDRDTPIPNSSRSRRSAREKALSPRAVRVYMPRGGNMSRQTRDRGTEQIDCQLTAVSSLPASLASIPCRQRSYAASNYLHLHCCFPVTHSIPRAACLFKRGHHPLMSGGLSLNKCVGLSIKSNASCCTSVHSR